jgi:hypothetical protein
MNIVCYYDEPVGDWNNNYYFHTIFNKLKNHYPEYNFEYKDSQKLVSRKREPCMKYAHPHMIIENLDTKKYFLISYWDKMTCISDFTGWDMENLVEIFTSTGVHKNDIFYEDAGLKYTPFSYIVPRPDIDQTIDKLCDLDNNLRLVPEKPKFKGYLYLFREFLKSDTRFDVTDKNKGEFFTYTEYINNLNNFAINMSLNGAGEICHRDMEILGLGTALFRPKLTVKFHDTLIPDYHYISIDYDEIRNEKNPNLFYKKMSDLMIQRWNEVTQDREYINFVARNGQNWFNNNVKKEKHAELAIKLLNFEKLK